jgi:homocysteine S-methyltransferase
MNAAEQAFRSGRTFLTPGGTETFLMFQQGYPLRDMCAFDVIDDEPAWQRLSRDYFRPILEASRAAGHVLLLDTLAWRAHPDFVAAPGRSGDLERVNRLAVQRVRELVQSGRGAGGADDDTVLLTGDLGPRGDGYQLADASVTPDLARDYHRAQIEVLARAGVDLLCAYTMTGVAESIGIVRAARDTGLPIVVSPTVETDGTLPDGSPLGTFVERVDEATGGAPLLYMVNCAHPTHLAPTLARARAEGAAWLARFGGLRANSSRKSHAELDDSTELDRGDPQELGREVARLQREYGLRVVGGCCGTDAEHVAEIAAATAAAARSGAVACAG